LGYWNSVDVYRRGKINEKKMKYQQGVSLLKDESSPLTSFDNFLGAPEMSITKNMVTEEETGTE
jgi:hypothetical protein